MNPKQIAHLKTAALGVLTFALVAALDVLIKYFGSEGFHALTLEHLQEAAAVGLGAALVAIRLLVATSPFARLLPSSSPSTSAETSAPPVTRRANASATYRDPDEPNPVDERGNRQ